jgi:exportin-2 (importin alpha re-exporter)
MLTYRLQDEEGNYKLPQDEVQVIKERLVGLMIASPGNIQAQLGEAISVIADSDFWRKWDTLTTVRPWLHASNVADQVD